MARLGEGDTSCARGDLESFGAEGVRERVEGAASIVRWTNGGRFPAGGEGVGREGHREGLIVREKER